MSELRLFLLGPAQFASDGRPVELSAAKATALLAYLAVRGAPQTREHVVALLWPESLPEAARKNLRNTLWTIRKAFGDEVFAQPDVDRLGLSDQVWADVGAFESLAARGAADPDQLQAAVDLYRGLLLDGLSLADAPDFEIWLAAERERFGQLYLRALKALIAGHRAAGRWPDVLSVARRALSYDELQEPMYRALMEAHARLGERSQALQEYERLRTALEHELGVEPLPETEALRAAILSGELGSAASVPGPTRTEPPPTPRAGRPSRQPFVGRDRECATLDRELELVAQGQARVVLVVGELGIGKSRLWQVWSDGRPPGPMFLETRCLDTTQSLPLAPLTRLFSQQACLELAESYLPSGEGEMVIRWAERALSGPEARLDPAIRSRAYYLLGAGGGMAGRPLAQVEAHLLAANALAAEHNLPETSARSQFELGNLRAQHGDLPRAREHVQLALALADAHSLFLPRQYLYSTQGEITLAEGRPDEAEVWFRRGLAEAEKHGNHLQAANIRANLGLAARARGTWTRRSSLSKRRAARRAAPAACTCKSRSSCGWRSCTSSGASVRQPRKRSSGRRRAWPAASAAASRRGPSGCGENFCVDVRASGWYNRTRGIR